MFAFGAFIDLRLVYKIWESARGMKNAHVCIALEATFDSEHKWGGALVSDKVRAILRMRREWDTL
jgi:hypothetical protein